jgi:two-component system chemotaxis sensor kinase CheA
MNMEQALQTYVAESRELLQDMENILLRMETEPADDDMVNAMFRSAHTIKGSAGLFGLDPIVAFTHVAENVLDLVRDGHLKVTLDLAALLLECCDHIAALLDLIPNLKLDAKLQARDAELVANLRTFLGTPAAPVTAANQPDTTIHEATIEASGGGVVASDVWHLSLRFGHGVLKDGMDPLSFIRYLSKVGELVSVTTLDDALPEMEAMDPESCYLGFEIDLRSEANKKDIENVFEFVRHDCTLHILPPHSQIEHYVSLIKALPEDDVRVGEILIASGALTRQELEEGLRTQKQEVNNVTTADASSARPIGEILVEQHSVQKEIVEGALDKQKQTKEHKAQESKLVRVQADKLDALINLVGELVIAGAGANVLAHRSGDSAMQEATSLVSRLVEEIRDGALQLRMVQIGETFSRFQRVVRDVSKELGKDIELIIAGAETELDKTVVEKIGDPLIHLVRNAIDHGIEAADVRVARGKPAKGTVRLNAYHDSGSIVIEIGDDGGGLKKEKILTKAIEKGLVTAGQSLTDHEIYQLIFEPGFSTADQVSNLSGRGVGMDVVRRNIEALRGTVELGSEEGVGTMVRIRLPLTLAIIDGFLVGVANAAYVVPLDMVLECVDLDEADREASGKRNYVNLRGEVLPYVRLRDMFEMDAPPPKRENVVVMQYGNQKAGLVVDELMGEFQTVIKPLGKLFGNLKGIAGSTILGTGEVALILDVPSLVHQLSSTASRVVGTAAA